jgi:predicted MFS family arabinose efflux permease
MAAPDVRSTVVNSGAVRRVWLMLTALGTVFALSHAFRTVTTIIAAPLRADLGASPQALGVVAGAFNLSFAALQVPAGVALDRYGPRRTVAMAFVAVVLGAIVSALAPTLSVLVAGQLVIGAGCAPAWLATLVFIAQRYPAERFSRLSGSMLAFGGVGMMLTGTPLAWVIETWSWRVGFAVLAICAAGAWLGIVALVVDQPPAAPAARETLRDAFGQIGTILAQPHTLGIVVLAAVTYASFITLRGLWVVPLLADRHGYGLVQSGHVVLAASLATIFGPPLFGFPRVSDRARRLWIVGCTLGFAGLFGLLARGAATTVVVGVIVIIGVLAGYFVLQYADVRAAYAEAVVGRALSVFNMSMFVGVALMQWISGVTATLATRHGFDVPTSVFLVIAALLVAGTLAFVLLPWPPDAK